MTTSGAAGLVVAFRQRATLRRSLPRRDHLPTLVLVAIAGVGGDVAYAAASHHGALSIVSAISSLYPLMTIALGRLVRDQRATRLQLAGIAVALLGAVLLGLATQ